MARVTIAFDLPEGVDEGLAARRIGALARSSGLATATRRRRRGASGSVSKEEAPDHVRRVRATLFGMARKAECDLDQLAALYQLRAVLDDALAEAAAQANRHHSWALIAQACGMTRQSAFERWAKRQPQEASSGA